MNSENNFVVPFNKRKTFCDRGFRTFVPLTWNALPNQLKVCDNIDSFKKALKTYLYRTYFNS